MGLVGKNISIKNLNVQPKIIAEPISSYVLSPNTNTVTTTQLPAGTVVSDLLLSIYVQQLFGGGSNYWTTPAGWSEGIDLVSPVSGFSYRTVQTGDAGFTWTSLVSGTIRFLQMSFRDAAIDGWGTPNPVVNNNATITLSSINTTVNNTRILAIILSSEAYNPPATPTGYTQLVFAPARAADPARPAIFVYTKIQATAGFVGSVTTNFSDGIGGHVGFLIGLKQA